MKLIKPKLKIDRTPPFKSDQLERKESADILTTIIDSIDEPFVLGVDGGCAIKGTDLFTLGSSIKSDFITVV